MAPAPTQSESDEAPDPTNRHVVSPRWLDIGLVAICAIWGVNFAVIKVALLEIEPLAFNALRFPLAAVTMFVLLRLKGPIPLPAPADRLRIVVLGLLGNLAYQYLFIVGLDATLAGNASLVLSTVPIWTLIIATVAARERHTWTVWAGVIATLVGMVFVVVGGAKATDWSGGLPKGDLMLVGAAVAWAAYTVGSQPLTRRYGALAVTSWTLWIGTLGLVVMGAPSLARTDLSAVSAMAWIGVTYAGVLAIAIAYLFWNYGVEHLGSARTAVYQNLVPIAAIVTAFFWLDEVPTLLQLVGATIIISGIWSARVARSRERPSSLTPSTPTPVSGGVAPLGTRTR